MYIERKDFTNNPELLIEEAYRLCYGGEVKNGQVNGTFIKGCIKQGHESPLEHAKATYLIHDVSRALTHQLVRHRLASYTQRSQRYCKENDFEYFVPDTIKEKGLEEQYSSDMKVINEMYNKWVNLGFKREDARYVLPNACYTTIMVTMNFREFRHFIGLRSDSHAQKEIRDLSDMILSDLYTISPNVFEDLFVKYFPNGLEYVNYNGNIQIGNKTHIGPVN